MAIVTLGCAGTREKKREATPIGTVPSQSYMRVAYPDSNTVQLQIAARKFVPSHGHGPAIWLTGASHVGEPAFYRALQKHLDAQGLVLFEGVKERPEQKWPARAFSKPKGPPEHTPSNKSTETAEPSLQATLATSLGLVFQLDAIDYARPHFRNSDLSLSQIQTLVQQVGERSKAAEADRASEGFAQLLAIMNGTSFVGGLMQVVVKLIGSSPKLQAFAKLALIETLGQVKGDISQMQGLPPGIKEVVQVLIHARNETVMNDVKAVLRATHPPKSIAIFYGAGHLDDLEKRLRTELRYRPADQLWLPAFSVDMEKSGITDTELGMIRSLVRWQMDLLQN